MNKDNFKKLIDAINFDGKTKFNMACFIGKLQINANEFKSDIINGKHLASEFSAKPSDWVETTNLFNCQSVGCIAGFATAVANDWKTPDWIKPTVHDKQLFLGYQNWAPDFEAESNEFLGLTVGQGKKLYYNTDDCIWKYLKYYESHRYPNLEYTDKEIEQEFIEWDDNDIEIDFGTIDYITAVNVLTRIMNEEIILGDEYGDIEILELAKQ